MEARLQAIGETVQALIRQRGRTDTNTLALARVIEGRAGERISHLPVPSDLSHAWLAFQAEPFRPHQSHALMALRRGEPVALAGASAGVANTLALLCYTLVTPAAGAAALAVTHDEAAAHVLHAHLTHINNHMPQQLRLSLALASEAAPNPYARMVICPAALLHSRLLRHHDRAWQLLWARLQAVLLPDIQHYTGVAAAHLADLLQRLRRVATLYSANPLTIASMHAVEEPEPALTAALGRSWRVVQVDDDSQPDTYLAVVRAGATRVRESAELALALKNQGFSVHVLCSQLEQAILTPIIADVAAISIGPEALPAQALVVTGYPGSVSHMRRLLRSGYQAVLVILGDLPHEQLLGQRADQLLLGPGSAWPVAPANAYATLQHALCAANESPLLAAEVESWGAQEIVDRLVQEGQLVDLPDAEICWKPGPEAGDPYSEFDLLAPSGAGVTVLNEQNRILGHFDPTGFERWSYPGAAIPPGSGGLRVMARNEEQATLIVRPETAPRRTLPLRRCTVSVRDTRQSRMLVGGATLTLGRVLVEEQIYGYREQATNGQPAERTLDAALQARWVAPACWFEIHAPIQATGQLIGWTLAATLPLRTQSPFTDLTPCYDPSTRRIYLVDSHPGGSGLAAWLYAQAETLLPLAYDIAHACRHDPFYEPLSRLDMDWLLTLLGRTIPGWQASEPATAEQATVPTAASFPPDPAQPFIELPPRVGRRGTPTSEPPRPRGEPSQERAPRPEPPGPAQRPPASQPPPAPPARPAGRPAEPTPPESVPPGSVPPTTAGLRQQSLIPPEPPRPAPEPGLPVAQTAPEPAPAEPEEGPPDPAALIARLKRQREQREATAPRQATPAPARSAPTNLPARFKAGDRIFCLPYGDGTVRESQMTDGQELLRVVFPDLGELEIDPVVNLVRRLEAPNQSDDDLL